MGECIVVVEKAMIVVDAHRKVGRAERRVELERLVGSCFRLSQPRRAPVAIEPEKFRVRL